MSQATLKKQTINTSGPDYPELKLFIGGEWVTTEGRKTESVLNPATEQVLGELPHASTVDLDRALMTIEEGFTEWRSIIPMERGRILNKTAALLRERMNEIAPIATMESGKTLMQARMEVNLSANIFEWYAEEGRRAYGRLIPRQGPGTRMMVVKDPIGPAAGFTPWNFPIGNPARKYGAALGAGCSCILKPAEETPASAMAVTQCLLDAGVPPKAVALVFGVPAEVSSYILASPVIRAMSFTGSIPVGKQLMKLCADRMIRTTMELGGHAPVVVFDDVDINKVLDGAVPFKFANAGQICVSPTRFYIQEKIYEDFVKGFTERVKQITVGNGLDENNRMGPMIHSRRRDAVEELIQDAINHGAKLHTGGKRLDGPGYFFEPTVISDVNNDARIMNEEPFGPVAIMNPFKDFDSVIQQANRLSYGLAGYAFTNDARISRLLGDQLEAGMLGINTFGISLPESPFGGVKESGHGSEEGIEGLESFLVTRTISEA